MEVLNRKRGRVETGLSSCILGLRFVFPSVLGATLLIVGMLSVIAAPVAAQSATSSVVVSQIYGGGGNSGATLRNDFIELSPSFD